MSLPNRNYKVVYDPDLDANPIKKSASPIFEYEYILGQAKDPRSSKTNYERQSRLYRTHFNVVEFDKTNSSGFNTIMSNKKKTVLVSNISPLSTESQIITVLSVYGIVHRIEIIKDRSTGGPIGFVKATFMDESSALNAVKNGNDRRVIISESMKIEFDPTGEKLNAALSPAEKTSDFKDRKRSSISPVGNTNKDQKSFIKAVISRKSLPFVRGALEELQRIFRTFGYIDIYHDAFDWYIIFDTIQTALRAQKFIHDTNTKVMSYPIDLYLPSHSSSPVQLSRAPSSVEQQSPKSSSSALPFDSTAKEALLNELVEVFLNDVKTRVARSYIYDFLNPYLSSEAATVTKKPDIIVRQEQASSLLEKTILESDNMRNIYKLPRFKKPTASQPPDLIKLNANPLVQESKGDMDKRKHVHHSSESSDGSSSEDDYLGSIRKTSAVVLKKKKLKKKSREDSDMEGIEIDDEESEEDINEAYRRITSKRRKSSKTATTKRRKSSSSSQHSLPKKKIPLHHTNRVIDETSNHDINNTISVSTPVTVDSPSTMDIDIDGDDDSTIDPMTVDDKEQKYDQSLINRILQEIDESDEDEIGSEPEETIELNREWDPFYQTKDVEDLEFLRIALMEKTDLSDPDKITTALGQLDRNDKRLSQCARTRGYYPIPDSIKATYLNKNKAVFEPAAVHPTTSRSSNRQLVVVMHNKTTSDSDIAKFHQLKSRRKQLKFQKSPIHEWGLFSEERIDANDMVIEYVGEVIRQQVALEREKEYEQCGIGSSYLFRIDEDTVIDATRKGSIARFINHCCAPNCSAKVITVDKQKKIVIYANRDIEPGEEITYDYKFPIETDKIPCLCGSKFCKGTLN